MYKCKECGVALDWKGEVSEDGTVGFYQCPKCKNVELHIKQYANGLRLTYP
jgi:Zn finger protein HypA/HybF involved in hydrogenase expression